MGECEMDLVRFGRRSEWSIDDPNAEYKSIFEVSVRGRRNQCGCICIMFTLNAGGR